MSKPTHIIRKPRRDVPVFPSRKPGQKYHVRKGSDGFHFESLDSLKKKFEGFEVIPIEEAENISTDTAGYPEKISDNGWHVLSNGEKVLGRKKALVAQKELDHNG